MQIEAGMAATAAIMDMLLHTRRSVLHLFAGAPQSWSNVSFSRLRTEGGFLISANRIDGQTREVQIVAEKGGPLLLANPWPGSAIISRAEREETVNGSILPIATYPGEALTLVPTTS